MNVDNLTIGQVKEIMAVVGVHTKIQTLHEPKVIEHGACIIVADRGHVWFSPNVVEKGTWTIAEDAQIIRRWGASEGINQLAVNGPLNNTVLDTASTVRIATKAIIAIIPTDGSKWKK